MSRGGRGASNSVSGVRAVANALGIARHDIGAFTQLRKEPPPTYPPVDKQVLALPHTSELEAMVDAKVAILDRFHTSVYYQGRRGPKDISRYTDRFKSNKRENFELDFTRLPYELNWASTGSSVRPTKRRKLDDKTVNERLNKLEAAEKTEPEQVADEEVKEEEKSDEEKEQKPGQNDEEEEMSDDDYLEEANDYVNTYFDNGENDGDSEDNLDEDHTF